MAGDLGLRELHDQGSHTGPKSGAPRPYELEERVRRAELAGVCVRCAAAVCQIKPIYVHCPCPGRSGLTMGSLSCAQAFKQKISVQHLSTGSMKAERKIYTDWLYRRPCLDLPSSVGEPSLSEHAELGEVVYSRTTWNVRSLRLVPWYEDDGTRRSIKRV